MNEVIVEEIRKERGAQKEKWGGPESDHAYNVETWVAAIVKHLGKTLHHPYSVRRFRYQMIRVAALAVAAIEWIDRTDGSVSKEKVSLDSL